MAGQAPGKRAVAPRRGRVTFVWGDRKKGIAVVRQPGKEGGKVWYDVHHVLNGKTVLVHRDYTPKAAAIREARSYANFEKRYPKKSFFKITKAPRLNRP